MCICNILPLQVDEEEEETEEAEEKAEEVGADEETEHDELWN